MNMSGANIRPNLKQKHAPVGGGRSSSEGVRCSHCESHQEIPGQEMGLRVGLSGKKIKLRGENAFFAWISSSQGPKC